MKYDISIYELKELEDNLINGFVYYNYADFKKEIYRLKRKVSKGVSFINKYKLDDSPFLGLKPDDPKLISIYKKYNIVITLYKLYCINERKLWYINVIEFINNVIMNEINLLNLFTLLSECNFVVYLTKQANDIRYGNYKKYKRYSLNTILISKVISDIIHQLISDYYNMHINEEKRSDYIERKKQLFKNKENIYIIYQFCKNIENNFDSLENHNNVWKLIHIVDLKFSINFNFQEMLSIIHDTYEEISFKEFISRFQDISSFELNNVLENFVKEFDENSQKNLHFLERYLKEMNIKYTKTEIKDRIESIKLMKSLESFEIYLNDSPKRKVISELDTMSWQELEDTIANLYLKMGYKVEKTARSRDQGADIVIEKFGQKSCVQVKNYSEKVNNKSVQEVVASMKQYNAQEGIVVTNSYFTKSAIELANANKVILIDNKSLVDLIEKYY